MSGAELLHNVSLFANLSVEDLEPLSQRLNARKYRQDEPIFEQGTPGNSLYIVKSGLIAIVVKQENGETQTLAHFGPGQVFGEFSLLDGLPRSAGAVSCERSELLVLSRPEFFMYLDQHPSVAINLVVLLSRRLRFTLQRTEHQEEITVSPLAKLADMLLHLTERYGHIEAGDSQLELRLTRGELAAMIGCPRSQAEEAINTLESKNILSMRGTKIAIHDLEGLRQITQAQP